MDASWISCALNSLSQEISDTFRASDFASRRLTAETHGQLIENLPLVAAVAAASESEA